MKGYHGLDRASTLKEQIVAGIITTGIIFAFNYMCQEDTNDWVMTFFGKF